MTQEEKAKAYDKALNIAREILDHTSENYLCTHLTKEDIKDMYIRFFPELQESEDEKVRKWLIGYFHQYKEDGMEKYANGLKVESIIAWLEKQGEKDKPTYNTYSKDVQLTQEEFDKKRVSDEATIKEVEAYKKGLEDAQKIFEKQDEQKPTLEMKSAEESLDIDSETYNEIVNDCIFDENKPKFKVGEWITNGDYTWKIVEVKPLDYILQSQDGNIVDDTISYVDEQFHSFTIQDVKDGNILVSYDWIFILKQFNSSGNNHKCYCHYDLTLDYFKDDTNSYMASSSNDFKPATKEQCNLLFTKMKEAGYEWNEEKKELKKIEQKSTNKVEPKFKVGDWVVYYRNDSSREVLQVYDIRDGRYYFTDNVHFSWSVKECDEKSHLWSISDAKEGDILACGDKISCPFIFHNLTENLNPRSYCGVNTLFHFQYKPDEDDGYWCYSNEARPATNEERELLFSKMKEAGYEWDEDNLELKDKFFKNPPESLGVTEKEYSELFKNCIFDDDKPNFRERYKNIKDSKWFKKTHENMSAGIDCEIKELEAHIVDNIYSYPPNNLELMDKINELVGEINNIKQELKDLQANAS